MSNSSAQQLWSPGSFGDDTPCCHEDRISFEEPRQVAANNGIGIISMQEADALSPCLGFTACEPLSEPCTYGRTGEIKTFSYERDADQFREWKIPEGSSVELRAKVGDKNCNAWSAFWLYGGEQEIDVFETLGENSPEDYDAGYWSDKYVNGEWVRIYDREQNSKIISRGFRVVRQNIIEVIRVEKKGPIRYDDEGNLITTTVEKRVQITDVDLSDEFINYGVEFTSGNMKFFINGVKYFDWNIDQSGNSNTTLPFVNPKAIRIGMGLHKDNCTFCPTTMEVDYLRVYWPQNFRYIRWLQIPEIMNVNETKLIDVNFLPSVNYNWNVGDLLSSFPDIFKHSAIRISCPTNLQTGQIYPISISSIFPDQSSELLTSHIYIQGSEAPRIPVIVNSKLSCIGEEEIRYEVKVKGLYPNNLCNNNSGRYEWSTDGGNTYLEGGPSNVFFLPNEENDQIRVRITNCFGSSAPLIFEIPQLDCSSYPRSAGKSGQVKMNFSVFNLDGHKIASRTTYEELMQLEVLPGLYILGEEIYKDGKLINRKFNKRIFIGK